MRIKYQATRKPTQEESERQNKGTHYKTPEDSENTLSKRSRDASNAWKGINQKRTKLPKQEKNKITW